MSEKIAIKEVQGLEQSSSFVVLYEIELTSSSKAFIAPALDTDLAAIQLYDYDTHTQLNSYSAIPVESEGFETSSTGTSPRPVITFSNVTVDFENLIGTTDFQSLVGKKLHRRRTLAKYIKGGSSDTGSGSTPIEFPRQTWVIDRVEQQTAQEISFELASPFAVEGLVLPYRIVGHNACPWAFQGASPTKSQSARRGGCTWHEEGKYNIEGTVYSVYVNEDDEYIVPSSTTFTTYSSGSKAANTYHKNTTTLGAASGVRRYLANGTLDTSADGGTVINYWQAIQTTSSAPSDSSSDWIRVRVFDNYNASTTYYSYTDDRYNNYVKATSGTAFVWKVRLTQSGNTPAHGKYYRRGDVCGKRLSSCQTRYGFNPISAGTATSTGKAKQDTKHTLFFGGFPGARKFK